MAGMESGSFKLGEGGCGRRLGMASQAGIKQGQQVFRRPREEGDQELGTLNCN